MYIRIRYKTWHREHRYVNWIHYTDLFDLWMWILMDVNTPCTEVSIAVVWYIYLVLMGYILYYLANALHYISIILIYYLHIFKIRTNNCKSLPIFPIVHPTNSSVDILFPTVFSICVALEMMDRHYVLFLLLARPTVTALNSIL